MGGSLPASLRSGKDHLMTDSRTIFADGILDASIAFGVARLTLAQQGSDGKPVPAGQLVMPLAQVPAFTNSLIGFLKQVEARMKEAQAQQAQQAQPAADAAGQVGGAVPGSFRFG